MTDLLIVGDGVAGLFAAVRCVERGVEPLVVSSACGASGMMSGAADWAVDSREDGNGLAEDSEWLGNAFRKVGVFTLGRECVATSAGIVRQAAGVGRGVLALGARAGERIGVLFRRSDGFSGRRLAESLNSEAWSRATATCFLEIPASEYFSEEELALPLASFASLLDGGDRRRAFAERLGSSPLTRTCDSVLTGPWLGRAGNDDLPGQVGETLSPPEGSFGARYEWLRERYFVATGIEARRAHVSSVANLASGYHVVAQDLDSTNYDWECRKVLVCTGGLLGGGQVVRGSEGEGYRWTRPLLSMDLAESGDFEGWDPLKSKDRWLGPSIGSQKQAGSVQVCGDARIAGSRGAPTFSVLGAAISGRNAVDRMFG